MRRAPSPPQARQVRRLNACYDHVWQARKRAKTLAAVEAGEWTEETALRKEYLGYFVNQRKDENEIEIGMREYRIIWQWRDGAWLPVMPWEAVTDAVIYHRFPDESSYTCTHLYQDSWSGRFESVARLAAHVESQLNAMGYPAPPWFDHPCPTDWIAGMPSDRGCYIYPRETGNRSPETVRTMQQFAECLTRNLADGSISKREWLEEVRDLHAWDEADRFIEWVVSRRARDNPRGNFIRDTRDWIDGAPITLQLGHCILSELGTFGPARDEVREQFRQLRRVYCRDDSFAAFRESCAALSRSESRSAPNRSPSQAGR